MACISLVGMPGAGKSTIGVILAKRLGMAFVDTDLLIQERAGCVLQKLVDDHGYQHLRRLENSVITSLDLSNSVIATGGSAVYSEESIQHLKHLGPIVYIDVRYEDLVQRDLALETRGIAGPAGQTLRDVYEERAPLYKRYADIEVRSEGGVEDTVSSVISALKGRI